MKIAICLPSKGRAGQLIERVIGLLSPTLPEGVELYVVLAYIVSDDLTRAAIHRLQAMWAETDVTIVSVERPEGSTAVDGWNRAYNAVADLCDWFVLGADDIVWGYHWLEMAMAIITATQTQVIGLDDGQTNLNHYAPHYMASAAFCRDVLGGHLAPPQYSSWWFDREVCEIAADKGLYSPGCAIYAIHTHPDWQTAVMDATYQDAWPFHEVDHRLYLERKRSRR